MDGCHGKGEKNVIDCYGGNRKKATYKALRAYHPPSPEVKEKLTLGKIIAEFEGVFELYVPADRPQDAKVINRAIVNRLNGLVKVEVFLEPMHIL